MQGAAFAPACFGLSGFSVSFGFPLRYTQLSHKSFRMILSRRDRWICYTKLHTAQTFNTATPPVKVVILAPRLSPFNALIILILWTSIKYLNLGSATWNTHRSCSSALTHLSTRKKSFL